MDETLLRYPLHNKQHGLLSNKGTESALSNTVNYKEIFLFNNKMVLSFFLDISAAFDSIDPDHIRKQMLKHGGDEDLVEWYYNYLLHRDIEIELHGEKQEYSTGMGFLQGGVCSPSSG